VILRRTWLAALGVGLALAGSSRADLTRALKETNLEKRSDLALANAAETYKAARAAYEKGESDQVAKLLGEIQESVELSHTSLTQTGKNPRKSPKYFKRAEIQTRELLKRLDAFEHEMGFNDRPMLEKVKARVQQIHDDLLLGLMEGKRK
jgi:hypothetical protein